MKTNPSFFIVRNMDSDGMFHQALLAAGFAQVNAPERADFIVHDAVHPIVERCLNDRPVFITPHTPQSSFLWDGILGVSPVCCNFVYGEAGIRCLQAYDYPYRVEAVGFGRCQVRDFTPTTGRNLLIVPAHPMRNGQYTYPEYKAWAMELLCTIMANRSAFDKVTLCWSEVRIEHSVQRDMRRKQIHHVVANPFRMPNPLQHMMKQIERADLVLSCNTTGCVAVAMGKPTVFITERGAPRSYPRDALHGERYHQFLRFPLQAEQMTIDEILAVRTEPDPRVEDWKQQNIGGNFDAEKFIRIVKEYV